MGESGFSFGGGGFAGGSFVAGFSEGAGLEGVAPGSFNQLVLDALPPPGAFERLPTYYAEVVAQQIQRLRAGEITEQGFGLVVGRYAQTINETPQSLVTRALALLPSMAATATVSGAASASSSDTGSAPMGFLDEVGGFFGGIVDLGQQVFGGVVDAFQDPGQLIQNVVNNPDVQSAIGLATQLGLLPGAQVVNVQQPGQTNSTGSPTMPTTMMNPDTGSPMASTGMGTMDATALAGLNPTALLAALRRLAGGPAGQIAVGVGSGLAVDQGLQALLGGGGGGPLMQFGEPPRNPLTGRRLSTLTFLDSQTGRPVVYKSQGTCLLSTGDVSSAKRVQRVARRAARGRRRSPARAPVSVQLSAPRNHVVCGSCLTSPCGCK